MSHVKDYDQFAKWRQKTGDDALAEHLIRRKKAHRYSALVVIVYTDYQLKDVADYIHDYRLHGFLQVEMV